MELLYRTFRAREIVIVSYRSDRMIFIAEILENLFQEGRYNYRRLLEDLTCGTKAENETLGRTVKTVEIFSFGDYNHYLNYRKDCIDLPIQGIRKLIKITLLGIFNVYEGRCFNFQEVIKENCLEQALKQFGDASPYEHLQEMLIEMADDGSIELQIDEANGSFIVSKCGVARDAYNPNTYTLRLLHEEDITLRSVVAARKNLQQWLSEKVEPSIQNLRQSQ